MNSLNVFQLDQLSHRLNEYLADSRLQEVYLTEKVLWFEFYRKGPIVLGVILDNARPTLGVFFDEFKKPKKTKVMPIMLFLRSHAVGQKFNESHVDFDLGRVLKLSFGPDEFNVTLELRMIPHAFNIIAYFQGKRVALAQIRALAPLKSENEQDLILKKDLFDLDKYFDDWKEDLFARARKAEEKKIIDPEFVKKQQLEKKNIGLIRMREELVNLEKVPWGRIGEHLKHSQSLVVPDDWESFISKDLSFAENLKLIFSHYREQEEKKAFLNEKIEKILAEIVILENNGLLPRTEKKDATSAQLFLKKAAAAGKRLEVRDQVEAVLGKTAKDNLAILRRAQSWDIWIHLKDFPGAHAIIHRNKKQIINQQDILKVGRWVLEQSLGKKRELMSGERYDLIYAECRFVKPIKGDKLGRVTYVNASALTLRVD